MRQGKIIHFCGLFLPFFIHILCELSQGISQRQVELRNLNLGWWYPEGNQQDTKKRYIHEDDCFPECRTGRSKDDTVAGLKVLYLGIQPVGEDAKNGCISLEGMDPGDDVQYQRSSWQQPRASELCWDSRSSGWDAHGAPQQAFQRGNAGGAGVQGSSARALSSHGGQGTALSVSHPPSRCSNRYLWQEDNQGRTSLDNWENMKELECRSDSEGKGVKLPKQTGKSHKKLS